MNGYCVTACRDPDYFLPFGFFLAVFAAFFQSCADGVPLLPGLRGFLPAFFLALTLAYRPLAGMALPKRYAQATGVQRHCRSHS